MEDRIAALRARVALLSPSELAVFRVKVTAAGIDWARVAPAPIPAAARPDLLPLSPAQMQFWLGQQVHPDSAAFSIAFAWDISGPLDVAALERALAWLVARHEPLRTRFPVRDGQPGQRIGPADFVLTRTGATAQADADFAARPFDLPRGPLFRAHLLGVAPDRHRLLLSFHHIIADGWSRGVFLRELAQAYRAFHAGRAPDMPDLPRQFADLMLDQQAWLDGPEAAAQAEFWRAELAALAPQELPASAVPADHAADTLSHRIDPALSACIAPAAAAMGVTPFVLLLAVFHLLQHRMTGSDDVAVGTPVAGRDAASAELIGLFVNTLVLRGRPRAGTSFRDWLAETRATFARAFDHHALPFARVVDAVGAARRAGQTPLFQVLFQVQTGYSAQNADTLALGDGLSVRQSLLPLPQAKFDLSWHMIEQDGRFSIIAEYRRGLFDARLIRQMIASFETLLAAALDCPDAAIEGLELSPPAILRGPDAPIPDLLTLLDDAAGRATVIAPDGAATHGPDLWAQAEALARYLRRLPELAQGQPLAICLPRGTQLIVALLAALRAGVPYVPLDPSHPAERRAMILTDAGAGLVLDDATLARITDGLPPDLPLPDLPPPDPDRIAYVIFTSGSTGRPKGVPVTHRALSNLIASMARQPGMAPGDRMLALTTIAFDIAALEILLPLATGATLVLGDATLAAEPDRLAATIVRQRITHLQATPATWRLLSDHGLPGGLTALCGGEALPRDLGQALLAGTSALWNMYGPTETTIWSAARRITADDLTGPQARIGGPVANTALAVLDRYRRPLPPLVPGELAITGAGLSPGYWQRPDLTADRFVDGFYLTGDRVRMDQDGGLTFLGRLDHQIKLNGYRVEPGEVEAALRAQPGITAAVVMAEGARLVAWCAGAGDPDALRAGLARHLPAYMIPAVVTIMDRLPLNPNGKIDRNALPRADRKAAPRVPETDAERRLLAIWSQVLGRDGIGVDDNFFAVGGASVSAMQIASRARAQGLVLTPAQMFEHQTVATQAAHAATAQVLPLSPWQAAALTDPGPWHRVERPMPQGVDLIPEALRAAHPVLCLGLTDAGWQTHAHSDLWTAQVRDGRLIVTAHPLLLNAASVNRLADLIVTGAASDAADDSYLRWLAAPAAPAPELLPLAAETADSAELTRPLPQVSSDALARALSRVLADWAGAPVTLAVADDAPLTGLGQTARVMPWGSRDPRGIDPRALSPGIARLTWDAPASDAVLHVNVNVGDMRITWHSHGLRADTLARLAARLDGELAAPAPRQPVTNKLDRLRAALTQAQG
ncbi:MAG: amino acid adenylation domain-containing protein [Paracoccus sp. (in: a-proteobacteria)]|uniref:non-ribosomal peptide synthetase n=1 Tax=Paracoccus sp. TaxID=267 RepID=UPI0026E012D5|nr:amino acid adenylation domain-containing protein [Paracoccus sp. (in: a-proteobacteria)]MDO5611890.1 amino acid adenylation domain-containing protein [Paracoccus sp. (in: a-proteobacteria)]